MNEALRKNLRGFNLAEVMIAFMLIVIALFALISMQAHSMRSQTGSREDHQAVVLAGTLLAEAEAAIESDFASDPSRPKSSIVDFPDYEAEIKVSNLGPSLKKIEVEVNWEKGPRTAHKKLETIVAEPY
jgi:Tfp pilus assembly protein PilE